LLIRETEYKKPIRKEGMVMKDRHEEFEEYEEIPEEYIEEELAENALEDVLLKEHSEKRLMEETVEKEMDIPEVEWKADIEEIEEPEYREREVKAAREVVEMGRSVNEMLESGEIAEERYVEEYEPVMMSKKRGAITRSYLSSRGAHSNHLGGLFEDWDTLKPRTQELKRKKGTLDYAIDQVGEDDMEELNYRMRMLRSGRISQKTYDMISEHVKNRRK